MPDRILDMLGVVRTDLTGSRISHSGFLLIQFHSSEMLPKGTDLLWQRFARQTSKS